MKINFEWKDNINNQYSDIFVGNVHFGYIRYIDEDQYLCSFFYTFLQSIVHKTYKDAKKYIETEITNYINSLLKGIDYGA